MGKADEEEQKRHSRIY